MQAPITYTNTLGELLGWLLVPLRSSGFFEAPVFMTLMTLVSITLYLWLRRRLHENSRDSAPAPLAPRLSAACYYALCFFLPNVIAVAFKTLIREELDYTSDLWFIPYVGPLHFYIASVIGAYLALLRRNRAKPLDAWLCLYIQAGLLGGYAIGAYRLQHETFDLLDPTSGVSGVVMLVMFAIYNWDVGVRFARCVSSEVRPVQPAYALGLGKRGSQT